MYRVLSTNQTIGLTDCEKFIIFTDFRGDKHVRLVDAQSRDVLTTSAIQTDPLQLVDPFGRQSGWAILTRHSIYVLIKTRPEDEVFDEKRCLKKMLLQLVDSL